MVKNSNFARTSTEEGEEPYFSIIIPAYNRAGTIQRVIDSCLLQSFNDIEVVIIDDASTDETVSTVRTFNDPRVHLLLHDRNRGVCAARNTGASHSRGKWVLLIDSDDEFLPDSLSQIYNYTRECPDDIERLGFLFGFDDGTQTPMPIPLDTILDYPAYLAWNATLESSDFLHCTRKRSFAKVKFSEFRAYENSYLLDFAKAYKTRLIPIIVGIMHSDCANRIDGKISGKVIIGNRSSILERYKNILRNAPDEADDMNYIISEHGSALQQYAPNSYRIFYKAQFMFELLAGRRWIGCRLAVRYLSQYPWCLQGWIILIAGMMGKRALAWIRAWKMQRRK